MTRAVIRAAAESLADLRVRAEGRDARLEDLPSACRPDSLEDAYAICR